MTSAELRRRGPCTCYPASSLLNASAVALREGAIFRKCFCAKSLGSYIYQQRQSPFFWHKCIVALRHGFAERGSPGEPRCRASKRCLLTTELHPLLLASTGACEGEGVGVGVIRQSCPHSRRAFTGRREAFRSGGRRQKAPKGDSQRRREPSRPNAPGGFGSFGDGLDVRVDCWRWRGCWRGALLVEHGAGYLCVPME